MESSIHYRPTKAIIDLVAIKENIKLLKGHLGEKTSIIAVVKGDGYGHGDVKVVRAALEAGAAMVSVATPDEAIRLRNNGVLGDVLVMAPTPVVFAKKAAELDITVAVPGVEWLKEVFTEQKQFKKPLKIHMKIDCGMGRVGLRDAEVLHSMVAIIKQCENIILDGVFTHFPCADDGCRSTTEKQCEVFKGFVELLPEKPRLVHVSNSAAALLYPEYGFDAVRFGISMYGIAPSEYVAENLPFPLQRALVVESELSNVKQLEKGSAISYGATYKTTADEWIGTIPIGYADGLRRGLRGQEVLIAGERMPIVGLICMDQCMVKLSRELVVGEKVVLIGKQGDEEIRVEEWARRLETIPYEIIVSISSRVPRVYEEKN